MNRQGTNAPLQPDAVPNVTQTAVLTRLNGRPHGGTARQLLTRPDVLWRMERAGWVSVAGAGPIGTGHTWRITGAGREALQRQPVQVIVWREVAKASYRSGRGGLLGGDTSRRAHWWALVLECGHTAERTVRYGPHKDGYPRQRGGTQHRSMDDVLPAPKRVRCAECQALEDARATAAAEIVAERGRRDPVTLTLRQGTMGS